MKTTAGIQQLQRKQLHPLHQNLEKQRIWCTTVDLAQEDECLYYLYSVDVPSSGIRSFIKGHEIIQEAEFRPIDKQSGVRTYRDIFLEKPIEKVIDGYIDHLQDLFNNASGRKLEDSLAELVQLDIFQEHILSDADNSETLSEWIRHHLLKVSKTSDPILLLVLAVIWYKFIGPSGNDVCKVSTISDFEKQKLLQTVKTIETTNLEICSVAIHSLTVMLLKESKNHWLYLATECPRVFCIADIKSSKSMMNSGPIENIESILRELYFIYNDDPNTLRRILTEIPVGAISEKKRGQLLTELDGNTEHEKGGTDDVVTPDTIADELRSLVSSSLFVLTLAFTLRKAVIMCQR